jgi:EmrB/QacA subfamily drug resistance transporter
MTETRRRWVLIAAMAGMFMAAVESTIVATALPSIVADLGGFHLFSWVFAVYLLGQAVTIPIYGRLADLHGRKRVFAIGAGLFLVSSAACGFAWNMVSLIGFRALQGLGAGAILPIATTIVGDLYPGAARGRVQGYVSSLWGIAAVSGPLLGAFLIQHFTWAAVFWVNLPIGAVSIVMLETMLVETVAHHRHRIDYGGSILLMIGTGSLMLAVIQWAHFTAEALGGLLLVAVAALTLLFFNERRSPEPMMPPDLWRNRVVAASNLGVFAIGGVMMGVNVFLPTYVQGVMGRSALAAGFALTAMSAGWPVGSVLTGRLLPHSSYRMMAGVGGVCLVAGSAILVLLDPSHGVVSAASGAFVIGLGMGFCNTTYLVATQDSVDWRRRGIATSMNVFLRIVGQSLAAAVFGGIVNAGLESRVADSGSTVDRLMTPGLRSSMAPAELVNLTDALAAALHDVYWAVAAVSLVALALALRLPAGLGPPRKS